MEDGRAKEIFDELVDTILSKEKGYDSRFVFGLARQNVISEVSAEIDAEKPVTKEVSVASDGDRDAISGQSPRSSRVTLITTVPFDEIEKLEILLKGIGLSHAAPALMADAIFKILGEVGGKPQVLSFAAPTARDEEVSKALMDGDITIASSADAKPHAVALATIIDNALTGLADERKVVRPRRFPPEVKYAN